MGYELLSRHGCLHKYKVSGTGNIQTKATIILRLCRHLAGFMSLNPLCLSSRKYEITLQLMWVNCLWWCSADSAICARNNAGPRGIGICQQWKPLSQPSACLWRAANHSLLYIGNGHCGKFHWCTYRSQLLLSSKIDTSTRFFSHVISKTESHIIRAE